MVAYFMTVSGSWLDLHWSGDCEPTVPLAFRICKYFGGALHRFRRPRMRPAASKAPIGWVERSETRHVSKEVINHSSSRAASRSVSHRSTHPAPVLRSTIALREQNASWAFTQEVDHKSEVTSCERFSRHLC